MDTNKIEEAITEKTKAIIPVHIYGHPCDMDELLKISKEHNLYLIEDCAQGNGAKYKNKDVGSMGTLGCFSFFPTKNLGAIGDGGAITTDSEELYNKLLKLRQYGWDANRDSEFNGYNSRLDELQAAILRVKLRYLNEDTKKRNNVAKLYQKYLNIENLILPTERENCNHAYHLFVIRTKNRDKLKDYLKEKGILAMIHYEKPVHFQKAFQRDCTLEKTETLVNEIISLPMYPELEEKDIIYVSKCINSFGEANG